MPQQPSPLWFLFHGTDLLLLPNKSGPDALPDSKKAAMPDTTHETLIHSLGTFGDIPCFAREVEGILPETDLVATDLRAAYECLGLDLYALAGKGFELIYWDRHSRFCPRCGSPTKQSTPISKACPACSNEIFPTISVATITLIRKGNEALFVRGRNFRGNNYGLVAGFLEPGESLEECLTREILEETALTVKNVRYFGSQPWPYPSCLMVGFTADYAAGELVFQQEELLDANFFSRNNLPQLPAKLSIARKLIDAWIQE